MSRIESSLAETSTHATPSVRDWFGLPRLQPLDTLDPPDRRVPWLWLAASVVLISLVLMLLPGRARIPPLVGSDYCYLLVAADRMYNGLGPTAPLPVAPLQPWEWQADWGFLTQWPIGYPILICALRRLYGATTMQACQWISVVACGMALVGWFAWIRRLVPNGATGVLVAAVASGCSVSTALLVNPSTDALLIALTPFVLLLVRQAVGNLEHVNQDVPRGNILLPLAGLISGALFWFRYASVFLPAAVVCYLLLERYRRRTVSFFHIGIFSTCAAVPVAALVAINSAFGMAPSVQGQLNLGGTLGFDFSFAGLAAAWWNFTRFGFYDYHWYSRWVFALWPAVLLCIAIALPSTRRMARSLLRSPGVALSTCLAATLLVMLVGVTAVFGDKYDYVNELRYYLPIKPLYFVLFVLPLMLVPQRVVRVALCLSLLVACSWTIQQEWSRPYKRWLAANRAVTPYGQWARGFQPGAAELYRWLEKQKGRDLIVISNFHDHITLETQLPALPIPPDTEALNMWVSRICQARGVEDPRVLFVLDHDNRWRDYWIKPTSEIIASFGLTEETRGLPASVSARVFDYVVDPLPGLIPG